MRLFRFVRAWRARAHREHNAAAAQDLRRAGTYDQPTPFSAWAALLVFND